MCLQRPENNIKYYLSMMMSNPGYGSVLERQRWMDAWDSMPCLPRLLGVLHDKERPCHKGVTAFLRMTPKVAFFLPHRGRYAHVCACTDTSDLVCVCAHAHTHMCRAFLSRAACQSWCPSSTHGSLEPVNGTIVCMVVEDAAFTGSTLLSRGALLPQGELFSWGAFLSWGVFLWFFPL